MDSKFELLVFVGKEKKWFGEYESFEEFEEEKGTSPYFGYFNKNSNITFSELADIDKELMWTVAYVDKMDAQVIEQFPSTTELKNNIETIQELSRGVGYVTLFRTNDMIVFENDVVKEIGIFSDRNLREKFAKVLLEEDISSYDYNSDFKKVIADLYIIEKCINKKSPFIVLEDMDMLDDFTKIIDEAFLIYGNDYEWSSSLSSSFESRWVYVRKDYQPNFDTDMKWEVLAEVSILTSRLFMEGIVKRIDSKEIIDLVKENESKFIIFTELEYMKNEEVEVSKVVSDYFKPLILEAFKA